MIVMPYRNRYLIEQTAAVTIIIIIGPAQWPDGNMHRQSRLPLEKKCGLSLLSLLHVRVHAKKRCFCNVIL